MHKSIVFVAYQDQQNLGVGYLSSMLLSKGFTVETIDFGLSEEEICRLVDRQDVLMVGFSLIFQYHFDRLRALANHLRINGVDCHFTVGGHYPSLRFESILDGIPEIDSVARFEGEWTVCELAEKLALGRNWKDIKGIAYRENGKPVSNELRPLISDLDTIPFPLRNEERPFKCMEKNCAFILASRGCVRDCSFCSIRKFYSTARGKLRRSRSSGNVVREMKELYEKNGTRVFLFQDDDFILPGRLGGEWMNEFIDELERAGLSDRIAWKISCRTDEVSPDLFKELKDVGLCLVYLGIESGDPEGLQNMNKLLTVEHNVRAVKILNDLDIPYDFGFMLFDPWSTFKSIRTNIDFLKEICGDGSSPVTFCKMIPYAETDIERRLANDGRLKGSIVNPDYDFLDPRLNDYWEFMRRSFHEWVFMNTGTLARLRWHRFEVSILERLYPHAKGIPEYKGFLRSITASFNGLFFRIAENAASIIQDGSSDAKSQLEPLIRLQSEELERISSELHEGMLEFQRQQTGYGELSQTVMAHESSR
jgi:anaerobic magnesium-protoporphyrin IX monomethyl ester cyclase